MCALSPRTEHPILLEIPRGTDPKRSVALVTCEINIPRVLVLSAPLSLPSDSASAAVLETRKVTVQRDSTHVGFELSTANRETSHRTLGTGLSLHFR